MPANMSTISIIEYVSFKSIFGVLRLRHPDLHFMLRLKWRPRTLVRDEIQLKNTKLFLSYLLEHT